MNMKAKLLASRLAIGIPASLVSLVFFLFASQAYLYATSPLNMGEVSLAPLPFPWSALMGYGYFFFMFWIRPLWGALCIISIIWLTTLLKGYRPSWWLLEASK